MKFTLGDCVKTLLIAAGIFVLFRGSVLVFSGAESGEAHPVSIWRILMAFLAAYLLVSIRKLYEQLNRLMKKIDESEKDGASDPEPEG